MEKIGEPSLDLLTGLYLSVGRWREFDSLPTDRLPEDFLPTSMTVESPVRRCLKLLLGLLGEVSGDKVGHEGVGDEPLSELPAGEGLSDDEVALSC